MKIKFITKTFLFSLLITSKLLAENQVGVIVPLTGSFARYGYRIIENIKELKKTDIKFYYEDEGCNPKLAIKSYEKLRLVNGIKIFLGPWCGSSQVAVAPMIINLNSG